MVDIAVLQEVRKHFSSKDIFLLTGLINKLNKEKPYQGMRIIYNAHMTLSSLVQIEALLASGAEVIATVGEGLRCDPAAMSILAKSKLPFIPFSELRNERCDFALDCCAKLLGRVHPTYGVVELTQTGIVKYSNTELAYPVISVDDTKVKTIETLFGTGDGFVRGFRKAVNAGLHHKKFVLFGYGKVGQGIVRALSGLTQKIIVIEQDIAKVQEAIEAGLIAYPIYDKEIIQKYLAEAFCVVTATGEKGMMSSYFERSEVAAKYLANMGSEDEWGEKFSQEEILNKKLAINFCLEQPTRVLFLDPIFYAQNTALDLLLNKGLTKNVHQFNSELDLEILNTWIANHYQINLEGDYLQSIIRHIPCFIYWKDRDSVYQGCNEEFAKAAGFEKPEEVVGKTDYELVWGQTEADIYRSGDQEAFKGKVLLNFEETQKQADGKQTTVLASKVPFHDDDGNIIGVLGIYTDITERKRQEEELRIAKEHAEAASRAKSEFLENMRHDIRTPLAGIVGFASILQEEVADPKIKEYADNIVASSNALQEFLNEILEAVRVTSGEVPLLKNKFDLKKRLSDVVNLNQAKAKQKHLQLLFDYDSSIPAYLIGDGKRVQRIVLELVTNALNFTDKGSVKVVAQLAKKDERDLVIKITVADTGIGIPLDKQQEIFAHFKRLTPSYEGIYKGAGLGLAVIKQFVDDLDAEIYVDSEPNKGSTFTCIVPLREALLSEEFGMEGVAGGGIAQLNQTHAGQQIRTTEAVYNVTPNMTRVLLVEDNVIASKMALHIFSQLNCQVDHAVNGQAALALAKQYQYDIIFMDVGLPDLSGLEVTKRIRLEHWNSETQVPIIALTAHVDGEDKQRCIEAGMNAVLSKPLIKSTASDMLNAFIPRRAKPEFDSAAAIDTKISKTKTKTAAAASETKSHLLTITSAVLDRAAGLQLTSGNEKLLDELLVMLIESFPEELKHIHAAHQKADWEGVRAIAHKLKGGATYCGAARLREACSHLDSYIRTGARDLAEALYQQMLDEIEQLRKQS
jgi:two-component system, OmpR family, aerobic respiration control sensor histidine kinase ArcB